MISCLQEPKQATGLKQFKIPNQNLKYVLGVYLDKWRVLPTNSIHETIRLELEINSVDSIRHILQNCLAFLYKEINLCYILAWNNKAIKICI